MVMRNHHHGPSSGPKPRARSSSGDSPQHGTATSSSSAAADPHHDRFWTRIFTRCRVFVMGIFLGAFVAQSFTVGLSLCSHTHDMLGFEHPPKDHPAGALRKGAVEAAAALQQKVALENNNPVKAILDENAAGAANSENQQPKQKTIPIETKPGEFSDIADFQHQHGVVIATKIHGPPVVPQLKQMLCLLTAAYNNRLNYDILIFVTVPLRAIDMREIEEIVHPASVTFETEKKTLQDQIKQMTRNQKEVLMQRCEVNTTDDLFWWSRCCEEGANGSCMPLAYTWQSEFRAKHLWTHKGLKGYKTMMWFDSDAMATRVWDTDPVAVFLRNDLKMFFDNFPQGKSAGEDLGERIVKSFNQTLCNIGLTTEGHLKPTGGNCVKPFIPNIHGFFHVTDLDFYARTPELLGWYNNLIGDTKFSRRWDDQLAVTIPAAIRAPDLSYQMESLGVKNDVWHNQFFDGKRRWRGGGYKKWWEKTATTSFPEAYESCKSWVVDSG